MAIKCYNCFEDYDAKQPKCPHCGHDPSSVKRVANHLVPGTILNSRYIIGEVCGAGGFGITYKAWDNNLDAIVAIKEFFPNGLVNRTPGTERVILFSGNKQKIYNYNLAKFIEEARIVARFGSHPNIVNVFEYFEANRTAYIVMEYMDGQPLDKYMKMVDEGRIDPDTSVEIALCMCNALRSIHKEGIVHRDIAPDNIFLINGGGIKLFDFGAARPAGNITEEDPRMMTIIIKPGYAPKEQYQSTTPQGDFTDIYALGATLYHMLTGVKPVESTDRTEENDPLEEVSALQSGITPQLNDTVMKAMAMEPHMRFKTITEFEEALQQKRRVLPLAKERKRRRRRRAFGLGISLAAVAVGCGLFAWSVNQQRSEKTLPKASLAIWYPSGDAGRAEALEAIRDEFCENYDTVTIELVEIPQAEYEDRIAEAAAAGEMPPLFWSDEIELTAEMITPLDDVTASVLMEDYWLLDAYETVYPDYDRLPTGFNMPVVYVNSTTCHFAADRLSAVDELTTEGDRFAVDVRDREIFASLYGEDAVAQGVSMEQFYSGSAQSLLSDSAMYEIVSRSMPARYRMAAVGLASVPCTFDECWSMGSGLKSAEKKAASRFMTFLLSDNSQDHYYIRNQASALPLNKRALEVYGDVYADYAPLFEDMTVYTAGASPE